MQHWREETCTIAASATALLTPARRTRMPRPHCQVDSTQASVGRFWPLRIDRASVKESISASRPFTLSS